VEAFNKDSRATKVSLSAGTYKGDDNKPWVLPSVREAEERVMAARMNKEYAGIAGIDDFVNLARKFALGGDSPALKENRVASVQALSGTGACRVIGEFYAKFLGQGAPLYLPAPSWGNHAAIFKDSGLDVRTYRYLDSAGTGFDCEGMIADLKAAPANSAVLLHACAHNPTGVDPSQQQWRQISDALKGTGLSLFFDSAYQGFATGDAEVDAFAVRHFISEGHSLALAQSFAKNFGLYGERVGVLSMVCGDEEEAPPPSPSPAPRRSPRRSPLPLAAPQRYPRPPPVAGGARALAVQDHRPPHVLQPAHPRRAHRGDGPLRRGAREPVARRVQADGGPHHRDAAGAQGRLLHLHHQGRAHLDGGRHDGQRRVHCQGHPRRLLVSRPRRRPPLATVSSRVGRAAQRAGAVC
jgi:hypothetical protein